MRFARLLTSVDSHTEGMPTRVVTGGVPPLPGATMLERRAYAIDHLDSLRGLLMDEPRGHAAMSGAILQPPTRPDAEWGVLYIESGGIHPMCGHGTMGVATVLAETGMIDAPDTGERVVDLDTPAGLVTARVAMEGGRATQVRLVNVPSFVLDTDVKLDVAGQGPLVVDLAYGGNFYPIVDVDAVGLRIDPADGAALLDLGRRIIDAVNRDVRPRHPEYDRIDHCLHVAFVADGSATCDGRTAVANYTGYFDRSPCGTGTSARMALLHHRGELAVGDRYVHESILGSRFVGEVVDTTTVGDRPAIIPAITGRAWITGFNQLVLDPSDPFPSGFKL